MSIRQFLVILGTFELVSVTLAWAQGVEPGGDDHVLIEQTARDYIEGWYTADAARMERALHPDMVKRYVDAMPGGRQVVQSVTRDIMVEMTRTGGGSKTPADSRNISVAVLEISGDIAVAKTVSSEFVDYLSLAKCNGRWVIVNVLWRFQAPPSSSR
jgi:hypothetical protein